MTRIGFAYNQKPESIAQNPSSIVASTVGAVENWETELPEEEPPSSSDEFAEWDSAQTIDAV